MRSRLPQFATLIPVLGYAVLWSDQFQGWVMRFDQAFGTGGMSPLDRVQFLYFGAILILIGMLSYWALCPRPLRHGSRRAYLIAVDETADPSEGVKAVDFLRSRWTENEQGHFVVAGFTVHAGDVAYMAGRKPAVSGTKSLLSAYYEALDRAAPVRSTITVAFLFGGAGVFLVPSVEVFFLALVRLAGF